jgi:hypothetical protein
MPVPVPVPVPGWMISAGFTTFFFFFFFFEILIPSSGTLCFSTLFSFTAPRFFTNAVSFAAIGCGSPYCPGGPPQIPRCGFLQSIFPVHRCRMM